MSRLTHKCTCLEVLGEDPSCDLHGGPIRLAVFETFGARCEQFDPECETCQAWSEVDRLEALSGRVTEQMLIDAYLQGESWRRRNGLSEGDIDMPEYAAKAARDYADRTLSALSHHKPEGEERLHDPDAPMADGEIEMTAALASREPAPGDKQGGLSVAVETCDTCAGNGEVVTDWERYMHGPLDENGDDAVRACDACEGTGTVPPSHDHELSEPTPAAAEGEVVAWQHTIHMDGGETAVRLARSEIDRPWGKPGIDFDDSFQVSITPLVPQSLLIQAREERDTLRKYQPWNFPADIQSLNVQLEAAEARIVELNQPLTAAMHALRSYQFGNGSRELAESIADVCEKALASLKGGA